jgi:hypothetical protein
MNLLGSLRSEILKTKRTASYYLTLIAAAATPFMFLIFVCLDGLSPDERKDPLNAIFKRFEMTGMAIFPIFVILICTLMPQLEYRNNTWKQVFASPQAKSNVFIAKLLNIQLLILVFLVANYLFMFLVAIVTHFIFPELNILHQPLNWNRLLLNGVNAYVSLLAVVAIQFWLGLRFKNFIVPIAVGLSLWIAGTLMVVGYYTSSARYFPYSFPAFSNLPQYRSQLEQVLWTSAGYAVLIFILAFADFRRIRMKA